MLPLVSRWYAFGPWALVMLVIWRQYGWRRALAVGLGGWLIAFAAEWSSTAGPGIPFGTYAYRGAGLLHDWRILGVPLFDSLSFTWLAFCTYVLAGALGARGARRLLLGALAMVAIDVVVDPVALRGASWWLGSIYSYPHGSGVWYGVSALNYLGWLAVAAALQLWLGFWLSGPPQESRVELVLSALLVVAVMVQSTVLALVLGIAPSAVLAWTLVVGCALLARGLRLAPSSDSAPRVLIACALSSEARAARRALGPGWVAQPGRGYLRWTRRRHPEVEVWETGMGLAAAARAASQTPGAPAILVAGVGGASSSDWSIGDIGIGSRLLDSEGRWRDLDRAVHARLVVAGVGRSASLASHDQVAEGKARRAELAALGVDIVEMETAAWSSRGPVGVKPPLVALRSVVDTPSRPLGEAAALVEAGATGPSPLLVARLLLLGPGGIHRLLELGRSQRLALNSLGRAVAMVVPLLEQTLAEPTPHDRTASLPAPPLQVEVGDPAPRST
ncbi:MAG: carotenoid biosynthesis protein [Candidatus Dormibacteria bacterium]